MKGGRDEAASQLEDVRAQWKRRHTEAAPPATSWSCAVCTLDNAAATALCDACGATRDPPPASPPTARWALHTSGAYLHSSHEPPAPASSLAVMDLNVWYCQPIPLHLHLHQSHLVLHAQVRAVLVRAARA